MVYSNAMYLGRFSLQACADRGADAVTVGVLVELDLADLVVVARLAGDDAVELRALVGNDLAHLQRLVKLAADGELAVFVQGLCTGLASGHVHQVAVG